MLIALMPADTRSLTGNAAAQCIAVSPEQVETEDRTAYARRRRMRRGLGPKPPRLPAPRPEDGQAPGLCAQCGFPGRHGGPGDCIDALRSEIAVLEFLQKPGRKPKVSV